MFGTLAAAASLSVGETIGAAVLGAALVTVVAVPYGIYAFHFEWARGASAITYAAYVLVGAAAGWGGYEAARAIAWHPFPDSSLLTGLAYGAFGQAIVRVHFDKIPGGDEAAEAFTPLSLLGDWLGDALRVRVRRNVRRELRKMPAAELAQYVSHLLALEVVEDGCLNEATKKEFAQRVAQALSEIVPGGAPPVQARSTLMAIGEGWVLRYKFDRPERA
jgi:hypothetical protein